MAKCYWNEVDPVGLYILNVLVTFMEFSGFEFKVSKEAKTSPIVEFEVIFIIFLIIFFTMEINII